jgi:hypothetical protein
MEWLTSQNTLRWKDRPTDPWLLMDFDDWIVSCFCVSRDPVYFEVLTRSSLFGARFESTGASKFRMRGRRGAESRTPAEQVLFEASLVPIEPTILPIDWQPESFKVVTLYGVGAVKPDLVARVASDRPSLLLPTDTRRRYADD